MSDIRKQDFYNNYLIAVCKFCKKNRIQSAIQEYESHIPQSKWDNLTLANAHLIIEDFDRAEYFASQYKLHTSIDSDSRYYAILYFLCRAQGKYKEAGEAYSRFNHINDSLNISALQENVRLTEARHQQELLNKESELNQIRNLWITVCGIVLLLLIILFISYRLRISRMQKRLIEQEKEQYRRLYEQLEDEHQSLQLLLAENNRLNDETKKLSRSDWPCSTILSKLTWPRMATRPKTVSTRFWQTRKPLCNPPASRFPSVTPTSSDNSETTVSQTGK